MSSPLPEPQTARELRAFLGMVGWCRLWRADQGLLLKPLHELLKTSQEGHLDWTSDT